MTCQDDANFTGPVSLFAGVETWNWTTDKFVALANWSLSHGVTTLIIKAFEWGSTAGANADGLWYGGMAGIDSIYKAVTATGMHVIFYGFTWPFPENTAGNIRNAVALLQKYGDVMLDMEGGGWSGTAPAAEAQKISSALQAVSGRVWLSYPADFAQNGMTPFISAMSPAVNVWLPMAYNDYLVSVYKQQLQSVNPSACVMPTLDLDNGFGPNNVLGSTKQLLTDGCPGMSLWYEVDAQANPTLLDQVVNIMKGQQIVPSPTTPSGETISVNEADQFQPNHTQDACGFFACAIVRSGSKPGLPPQRSVQQIIDNGEAWYAQYDGDNGPGNGQGMGLQQLYDLIRQMTYDYRVIDLNDSPRAHIAAWVKLGFPVILALGMSSIYDLAEGGSPYYWNTSAFNHIITVTGVTSDGFFLCRDSANCTDLNDPNSLRPGPRKYDQNKFSFVSATAVLMPWLPVPPAGFDPTKGSIEMLPKGWTDDGNLLHNPKNKFTVGGGFRRHIVIDPVVWQGGVPLENEDDSKLVQLEESNPGVGLGHRQTFEVSVLGWQASTGNVYEQYVGQELLFVRNDRNVKAAALAKSASDLQSAQAQVVALQAALATCQASGGLTPEMQAAINQAVAAQPQVDAVLDAFKPFVK